MSELAALERLQATLEAARCSSRTSSNIRYLTGFESSNAALLVDPEGPAKLFTDFRYIEARRGDARRRGGAREARR